MNKYDVIVIGAGYSGLMATLHLKNSGKKVLLLEARDRVGGRVYTQKIEDNQYVDLGGAWVGPGQNYFYDLINKTGNSTFKTYDEGKSTLWYDDKVKHYKGLIPPLPIGALISLDFAIKKINKLSKTIDLEKPWTSPYARKWDSMTLQSWMDSQMSFKKAKDIFKIAAEAIWAAHPNEISFLHALYYTRSGVDLDTLMNVKGGAQEERIVGGAQQPALKLGEELAEELRLNSVVTHVFQNDNSVLVRGKNFNFEAQKIIIAIPPTICQKINFEPPLPANRQQLMQRMPMGTVTKTFAVYDKPFWRENGLNGLAASNNGFTTVTFDNSPKDGSKGILMGFVLANQAKSFANLDEKIRKETILNSFARMFGSEALQPEQYLEHTWAEEEFSGGCYAAYMPTGVWTSLGHALRKPVGNIHWAGTETATEWNGYIDGAIQAGIRAANEIIKS